MHQCCISFSILLTPTSRAPKQFPDCSAHNSFQYNPTRDKNNRDILLSAICCDILSSSASIIYFLFWKTGVPPPVGNSANSIPFRCNCCCIILATVIRKRFFGMVILFPLYYLASHWSKFLVGFLC